jgi:hypothetical protein
MHESTAAIILQNMTRLRQVTRVCVSRIKDTALSLPPCDEKPLNRADKRTKSSPSQARKKSLDS